MLEETPEFLQDTPDHDRLWFEQRPPKDFDFDGSRMRASARGLPERARHGRLGPRRGHSSVGRAPALQAGGRRFDPGWLH